MSDTKNDIPNNFISEIHYKETPGLYDKDVVVLPQLTQEGSREAESEYSLDKIYDEVYGCHEISQPLDIDRIQIIEDSNQLISTRNQFYRNSSF